MSDSNSERRNFSRINFSGEASIRQGNKQWPVDLVDISLKGLLIEEHVHWDIDTEQTMEARLELLWTELAPLPT